MDLKRTTIYLTHEQLIGISAMARRKGRPTSQLIREAVAAYIADDDPALPDWIGSWTEEVDALNARNVKDWLKDNWHPE